MSLCLSGNSEEFSDSPTRPDAQKPLVNTRFFHIKVRNHHRKAAANCSVYLEKATQLPSTNIVLKTVEFKWAGVHMPSVGIAPGGVREFDAFSHFFIPIQLQVQFNALSDSPHYRPVLPNGAANYELSYVVRSENFSPARGTFKLCLRDQLNDTTFHNAPKRM